MWNGHRPQHGPASEVTWSFEGLGDSHPAHRAHPPPVPSLTLDFNPDSKDKGRGGEGGCCPPMGSCGSLSPNSFSSLSAEPCSNPQKEKHLLGAVVLSTMSEAPCCPTGAAFPREPWSWGSLPGLFDLSILALSYPLLPQKEPALLGSAPNPMTRPTHIPLDWPRGQSQKFLEQCLGCWGPVGCLPPEPLASSRLVGSQQEGEYPTFPLHFSALSRLGPLGKAVFWPPFQGWSL